MLDMSPTDAKELWLIQWIKDKDLDVSAFHGKELSLKVHADGKLGSLESSSGKSYDLVSFAYQQPNATVFLPSGSEMKPVAQLNPKTELQNYAGKRGIQMPLYCRMQKGTPQEPQYKSKVVIDGLTFESPEEYRSVKAAEMAAAKLALTSLPREARSQDQSAGSSRKAAKKEKGSTRKTPNKNKKISGFIAKGLAKYCSSQGPTLSAGALSKEQTPEHKRDDESTVGPSDVSGKASEGPDGLGSQSNTATEMPQTTPEMPKKKKAKIAEQ